MASSLLLNLQNDCLRSQWRSALERNHRVSLKPVIFGFIIWDRQDSGHVYAVMKVLRSGWRGKSFYSTRCSPYENSLCPCYTHVYLFLTAQHCKSRCKDRTSALCCRGKTLAVNQHLVLACSYKNQSCFFLFEEGVATSPCQERRGIGGVFVCFPVNTSEMDDEWVMLSAHRNAVVFVGWALDEEIFRIWSCDFCLAVNHRVCL